jgi:hypothetical protein
LAGVVERLMDVILFAAIWVAAFLLLLVNGLRDLPVGGRQFSPLAACRFSPTAAR